MTPSLRILGPAIGLALVGFSASALAQAPTVDPSGRTPIPPPAAPAAPPPIIINPIQTAGGETPAPDTGFYHNDDIDSLATADEQTHHTGLTPETHVVRKGDTLWDICWFYFNNPWEWPKIWSYNPSITNPHWIYPGDVVRLFLAGLGPVVDVTDAGSDIDIDVRPAPIKRHGLGLTQYAFVERKRLDEDGTIGGGVDEKQMMATGDSVYISYPKGDPPKVGDRFSVYTESTPIKSAKAGDVGSYVRILGEVEVESVKKGKRARATVLSANAPIERGQRVGPIQKVLQTVTASPNKVDAEGRIVGIIAQDQLVGTGQVIIVDLGSDDGIEVGNIGFVVRRGDGFSEVMGPGANVGQNDERFPARALGQVIFVQVGKRASIALVSLSVQEMGNGDMVLVQKSK